MLSGKKFIVTAGPTYEPIDPVRFIGNRSSGKMGFYLAEVLALNNAQVFLVAGPVSLTINHPNIFRINVETAEEMFIKCIELFPGCQAAIMAAAVADYTPEEPAQEKIKKNNENSHLILKLKKTKDILAYLAKNKREDQLVIGFCLETNNEVENAVRKLKDKKADIIILNSLKDKGAGFGSDTNKITIFNKNGEIVNYHLKDKKAVAEDIIDYLMKYLPAN